MTLDKLRTATGRAFRTTSLLPVADLSDQAAAAAPGSVVLSLVSDPFISCRVNTAGLFGYRPIFVLSQGGGTGQIRNFSDSVSPEIALLRARVTPSLNVLSGDALGTLSFAGQWPPISAGAVTCQVRAVVDGTPSATSYPTRLDVLVTPTGATLSVLGMRLTPEGNLLLGNTTGTERLSVTGNIQLTGIGDSFKVGADSVVGARRTGWEAPTGTATRTTFDTSTATTTQLAERLKALIDDLTTHGLIGA